MDAIVARLVAETGISISMFTKGATAPTSDIGLFYNDSDGWMVWSSTAGAYVSSPTPQQSLGWIAAAAAPDHTVYTFWISLDGSGVPQDLLVYNSGAWVSVIATLYVSKADLAANYLDTADVNTAIDTALSEYQNAAFSYMKTTTDQTITAGAGDVQVTFDTKNYDPNSVFASNVFTAPYNGIYRFLASMWIGLSSGAPTSCAVTVKLRKNGSDISIVDDGGNSGTGGRTDVVNRTVQLNTGDVVDVGVAINTTGVSTWIVAGDARKTFFEGFLVQPLP